MADPILFIEPDAEGVLIAHLLAVLPGLDASGIRNGAPDGRRATVRKTGGRPLDPAHWEEQLTVTCWGPDELDEVTPGDDARRVAFELVKAGLAGRLADTPCGPAAVLSSPYPDPDPVTGRARYSATYAFVLRGSAPTA